MAKRRKKIEQTNLDLNVLQMKTFIGQSLNIYTMLIKAFKDGSIDLNIYNQVVKHLDENDYEKLLSEFKNKIG